MITTTTNNEIHHDQQQEENKNYEGTLLLPPPPPNNINILNQNNIRYHNREFLKPLLHELLRANFLYFRVALDLEEISS